MSPEQIDRLLQNQREAVVRVATVQRTRVVGEGETARLGCTQASYPDARRFTVPLPPSWNRAFKAAAMPAGGGKWRANVYKSREAKAYAAELAVQLRHVKPFPREQMLRVTGRVVMERAGCDIDDRVKVLFDALSKLVWEDDEQVATLGPLDRLVDSKHPRVELCIERVLVDRYGAPLEPQLF